MLVLVLVLVLEKTECIIIRLRARLRFFIALRADTTRRERIINTLDTDAVLEIRIHLEDRRIYQFIQNDPVLARTILDAIHPNHLFSTSQLLIGSEHMLTAFQPQLIIRVDLITELEPNWLSASLALDTREITVEEFELRCHPSLDVQLLPNREIVVFSVWEMINGERIYLQTRMTGLEEKKLPVEVGLLIKKVMTSGGMLARGREVDYIVLNPARLLRFTSYVGLQELPVNAWPMKQNNALTEDILHEALSIDRGNNA